MAYVLSGVFLLRLLGTIFALFEPPVHDVADDRSCQQAEQLECAEDGGIEGNWGGRRYVTGSSRHTALGNSLSEICRLSEVCLGAPWSLWVERNLQTLTSESNARTNAKFLFQTLLLPLKQLMKSSMS